LHPPGSACVPSFAATAADAKVGQSDEPYGFRPLLFPAPAAAHYLGVSETKLRSLGIPRKVLDGKRLFDRRDLDDFANTLSYEGEGLGKQVDEEQCDKAFGLA